MSHKVIVTDHRDPFPLKEISHLAKNWGDVWVVEAPNMVNDAIHWVVSDHLLDESEAQHIVWGVESAL